MDGVLKVRKICLLILFELYPLSLKMKITSIHWKTRMCISQIHGKMKPQNLHFSQVGQLGESIRGDAPDQIMAQVPAK